MLDHDAQSNHAIDVGSSEIRTTVATVTMQQVAARLGPVACWLCQTVEDYRTNASDAPNETRPGTLERELRILKSMAQVLDRLDVEVSWAAGRTDSPTDDAASKTRGALLDYVRLPLVAILQLFETSWDVSHIDSDDDLHRIVQSAQWNCVERAARTWQGTLRAVPTTARPQQLYTGMTACIAALPTSDVSQKRQTALVGRLDTGDDCIASLLSTTLHVLSVLERYQNDEMTSHWMRLLPLLVDNCIALVEPPAPNDRLVNVAKSTREPALAVQQKAVTTIQRALRLVPTANLWQRIFPGVYCGLYRRILGSIRLSQAQPLVQHVLIACVEALVSLLSCSLPPVQRVSTCTAPSVLEQLQALSLSNRAVATLTANNAKTTPDDDFLGKIQQRIPSTLSILVNMLTSSQSFPLREQAIPLNRVLLVETGHCWSNDLTTTCLESVLVLCSDSALTVTSMAHELMSEFTTLSTGHVNDVVVPRIMDVMERLELLVQSRSHELELRSTLKLITGYLNLSSKHAVKILRKALGAEPFASTVRRAFSALLSIPLDHDALPARGILVSTTSTYSVPKLGALSEETERSAYEMIHAFGRVLGPKQTTIFADAGMADVYISCVRRVERQESLHGRSHVLWLHERIGTIRMIQEVVTGGFSVADSTSGKSQRNRLSYLLSLGNSILPIMVSDTLWDLPTQTAKVSPLAQAASTAIIPSSKEAAVSAALQGNATIICCLLGVINTLVGLLGESVSRFTPILLYPLLERAGERNANNVRDAALFSLQTLAAASGSLSVASLLTSHMESSLMGCMLAKIRVPGGQALTPETALERGLLAVVDSAVTVFRLVRDESIAYDKVGSHDHGSILLNMEELTMDLTNRFDHASTKITSGQDIAIHFLSLFRAAICLLRTLRERSSGRKDGAPNGSSHEPWFDLLAPFERRTTETKNPSEGFASLRAERVHCLEQDTAEGSEKTSAGLTRDIDFVSHLARRCGYLLSHASLRVQIESCDVLTSCFAFLGWVAASSSTPRTQANGPATAVMRQVHSSWQPIAARLKATCSTVMIHKSTCLIIIQQPAAASAPSNIGEQRIYLAKILDLISAMVECSDDFMASRFRQSVWPCVRDIFRGSRSMQHTSQGLSGLSLAVISQRHRTTRVESEVALLLAALRCVSRVFGHRPVGIVLSGLIPSVGAELWYFLDEDEPIATACIDAVQMMLLIDCDALWRPIFEMAGKSFPLCPFKQIHGKGQPTRADSNPRAPRTIAAASQLLSFLDALPEQILE